ncbi:MAG: hypothetical protein CMJ75_12510 [Planctomycetaceae bacterium]|nr:hypothetical protein [Planctomycetaceae bacterium]
MRLTLRTMLAYLDDILEPADAKELGKKIESSEFANNLVHHIRGCTQHLRLGAPELDGKGLALDSNTVAEYLDNTLSQERVPDFEKVCLESDIHLAEVAACHQILTLVLGEPADVSPAIRNRTYQLVAALNSEAETNSQEPTEVTGHVPPPNLGAPVTNESPVASTSTDLPSDVPEIWQERSGIRLWPLAVTLAVAFLVAGAGIAIWSGWPGSPTRQSQTAAAPQTATETAPAKSDAPPAATELQAQQQSEATDTVPDTVDASTENGVEPVVDSIPSPALSSDPALPTPENDSNTNESPTVAAPESPLDASPEEPAVEVIPTDDSSAPEPNTEPTPVDATADESVDVGRYVSDEQVLARLEGEIYKRLSPEGILYSDDHLLVLPAFRPRILVGSGILISLLGPTEITLGTPTPSGVSRATVHFGRLQLSRGGTPSNIVLLTLGNQSGQVTLQDPQSQLSIEVRRYLPPGINPEENEPKLVVQLQSIRGNSQWSIPQSDGEPLTLDIPEGMQYVFVDQKAGELSPASAQHASPRQLLDEDAAEFLREMINNSERDDELPISISLREQLHHRRIEVRALAARCLAALDQFDAVLDALTEPEFKSFWENHILALQHALTRGPETSRRLRGEWERKRDETEAAQRYRLLWGYNPEQLQTNGAQQLVGYLEHPSMDVRVLSSQILQQITGRTKGYHAYRSPQVSKAQASINSWKRDLQQGRITYETLPSPMILPETRAATSAASRKRSKRNGKRSR